MEKDKVLMLVASGLALIGFIDSAYLTTTHYFGVPIICGITEGCEAVTTSVYAYIFGVPTALFGTMYYGLAVLGWFASFQGGSTGLLRFMAWFAVIGVGVSAWLVFVQAFLLKQWCQWCLISAACSVLIFGLAIYLNRKGHNKASIIDLA
ncbi:MAG: vitamin K epoxide reductase family protein [Patescibacteria group bacterium]